MKILIIGGVAGGATAAARLRRIDENAEIIMVDRGEYISFANCGLPYHIGGIIEERGSLLVQTVEGMKNRFGIDVRVKTEAVKINKENKSVLLKDLKSGREYEEKYDYLVLSPGAEPLRPPISGINSPRIFALRNIPDMDKIISYVSEKKPRRAVVIGGGFIGIETAENLAHRGINITIVEMADQIMAPIDYEMASIVHSHLKDKNIELYLKDGVESFEDKEEHTTVFLKSGKRIKSDMVILAIGVKPDTHLAKDAGLRMGDRGGIYVDEYLTTSDAAIYAVGDAIETTNFLTGKRIMVPLAGPANRQARIAADNIIYGNKKQYDGIVGTSIAKVFDLTVAATGFNEKTLKMSGIEYTASITHGSSHASYYPGAMPITIKLLFDKSGLILGAQVVGIDGADKRVDVIATAIKAKMTVEDLESLELAYAPPFGSAKDPVNIAGYAANNILKGDVKAIYWNEIDNLDLTKVQLVDVRTKEEYELGTIKNALNIPLDELRGSLKKIDSDKQIVVFCQVGLRGYLAYRILEQNGFKNISNLSGGYKIYSYAVDKQSNPDIFDYEQIKPIEEKKMNVDAKTIKLNACGLQCPGPILETYKKFKDMSNGDVLEILATDPGFKKDIVKWAEKTGNKVLDIGSEGKNIKVSVQKGTGLTQQLNTAGVAKDNKTIVVFSNDFDKALAAFVIANGAAAMGKQVTMFFTFWGLNVLRKKENIKVKKGFIDNMFGLMMPKGSSKLILSKMNFGGMGTQMMKMVMRNKNVDSLEIMMKNAIENGVKLVACQMSMDIMGIKPEELMDVVEIGGVATYLADAEDSNVNLFI